MLVTALSVFNAIALLALIMILLKFKRSIPDILQDAFNQIGEQLTKIFKDPMVSRSMSVLGKKSGDVRASKALRNRVAEKAIGQSPLIARALDYFDLSPIEGLQLMNDPVVGPIIQRTIGSLQQGLGNMNFGNNGGGGSFRGYGVEE